MNISFDLKYEYSSDRDKKKKDVNFTGSTFNRDEHIKMS